MLCSRGRNWARAVAKLSLGPISSAWLISLPALDQCQEILISCSSWPWRAVLGTVICCTVGRGPAQAFGRVSTAVPPPASVAAGLEQGKAVLRAQGPHRELVGVFGLSPQGTTCWLMGESIVLLHCTGHHPAPPEPSLPLLGAAERPFLPNAVPSLSCSRGGGSLQSSQDVLGPGLPWFRA